MLFEIITIQLLFNSCFIYHMFPDKAQIILDIANEKIQEIIHDDCFKPPKEKVEDIENQINILSEEEERSFFKIDINT